MAVSTDRRRRCRSRFPIFERLTYINSCSQGALSDSVRAAYDDYLTGWDERGAPWDYWVERTETARATFARLVGGAARRRRRHDVALRRRERARERARLRRSGRKIVISDFEFPTIGQIWHAQELRGAEVVHVPRRRRRDPGRAVRRGDRRADGGRLDRGGLLPQRLAARGRGDRADRARPRRARACSTPTRRSARTRSTCASSASTCSPPASSSTCSARPGSASCGRGRGWRRELLPTQTGWFADRDIFEMDITDYSPSPTARRFQSGTPPVPTIYAGIAGHRADAGDRDRRDARARERAQRAPDRGRRRARRRRRRRRATPERRGALVCIRSTDAPALVAALAGGRDRHLGARRQPPRLGARLQHRRGHRRASSPRSPVTAAAGMVARAGVWHLRCSDRGSGIEPGCRPRCGTVTSSHRLASTGSDIL